MTTTDRAREPAAGHRVVLIVHAAIASFAVQDWIVGAYLAFLCCCALLGRGPSRDVSVLRMTLLFAGFVIAMILVRGRVVRHRLAAGILYRIAIYGPVQISYLWLRDLLNASSPRSYDAELYELDLQLFRIEPAVWLDRFVTFVTSEWFAFFYFSYFVVLALHVWPMLFLSKRKALLAEFGLTMLTVYCVAQAIYLVLPGFGPHRALAASFAHDLPSGFWWRAVLTAVHSGGAERDAFPSLHTAGPTAIALFSIRHRAESPFKYTWPITVFFAANIVVSTMFLRWHYLVDVVAGLVLASVTLKMAAVVSRRESQRRKEAGLEDAWPAW